MRISKVKVSDIATFLRLDDYKEQESELKIYLESAKAYIKGYTNLTEEEMDEHEDLTTALFVIIADHFENRLYQQSGGTVKSYSNQLVDNILNLYRINQLGKEDENDD